MPVTDAQAPNSGSFEGTTGSATLPTGTTAGNMVVLVVGAGGGGGPSTPTGFVLAGPAQAAAARSYVFYRGPAQGLAAGETSWTITPSISALVEWVVYEKEGVDPTNPVDAKPSNASTASAATTVDTFGVAGTNPMSTAYAGWVVAAHVGYNSASTTVPTWSGHTQGLVEEFDFGRAGTGIASSLSVSSAAVYSPTTFDVSATASSSTSTLAATHVVFAAAGAKRAALIDVMFGGAIQTTAGLATGNAGAPPFDTVTGTPTIVTAGGENWLELSSTAAAENVTWTAGGALGLYQPALAATLVPHFAVLFPTALPSVDVDLLTLTAGANSIVVRYRTATQQIGVKIGTGTEQLSPVVAADTRYYVDLHGVASTSAATADWQFSGADQTQATGVTTAGSYTAVQWGWSNAITATVRLTAMAVSKVSGQYPQGDLRMYALKADPAGTLTISGTTGNFQVMTANGTLAAWSAANALAAIDDVPPTIGASADGIVQSTLAASDYVEIPMETRDCAANGESIRAVRWYFPGWAASATANAIGFRAFDGTTETTLFAAADPNFDNSTTTPAWMCRMHRTLGNSNAPLITQAMLDALRARVGFSSDATPAVGVHAVVAELAVRADPQTVRVAEVTGLEGVTSSAHVDARLDADSAAVIAYDATPAPDFDATVSYVERGTPTSTSLPAGAAVATEVVGADTVDDVTQISIGPA